MIFNLVRAPATSRGAICGSGRILDERDPRRGSTHFLRGISQTLAAKRSHQRRSTERLPHSTRVVRITAITLIHFPLRPLCLFAPSVLS